LTLLIAEICEPRWKWSSLSDLVPALELADGLDHLGGRQAELREVAPGLLPAAGAARRQPGADPERRLDLDALGDAMDLLELGRLLDDEDHRAAHLGRQERGLDVLLVLVAVADDQGFLVGVDRHDREQLGLAAGLEAVVERTPELDDLLDDGPVLVDLDRVHAAVVTGEAVLADRAVERAAQELDAGAQDVAEAEQDRQLDATRDQLGDQLLHIDDAGVGCVTTWLDDEVAGLVHAEVAAAPARDVVRVVGVGGGPPAQRIMRQQCLRTSHVRSCNYGQSAPHAMTELTEVPRRSATLPRSGSVAA